MGTGPAQAASATLSRRLQDQVSSLRRDPGHVEWVQTSSKLEPETMSVETLVWQVRISEIRTWEEKGGAWEARETGVGRGKPERVSQFGSGNQERASGTGAGCEDDGSLDPAVPISTTFSDRCFSLTFPPTSRPHHLSLGKHDPLLNKSLPPPLPPQSTLHTAHFQNEGQIQTAPQSLQHRIRIARPGTHGPFRPDPAPPLSSISGL